MPRIDQETVQRILDAADIVDVVSDFVKLRRSGANFKGLCPFHNDRTPSFHVNRARNICKCFSCGKGGGPVNFIMEHEQLNFQEALRYLARKYNIEIVERELSDEERRAENKREALYAANAFALEHFKNNLASDDGQAFAMPYFMRRGISQKMIERFHLGYSLDKPTALLDAASQAGFATENLVETGLVISAEREGRQYTYDRFRGRVIYPIHTLSGRVVGFGGRTMSSDKKIAKYVNSPESVIYHKKNELYGLFQSRSAIGRKDKCIMVEGYMDVISLHQAGIENVVASSGTALTDEQIRIIRRFTDNVTLIYDSDAAGIKASLRGINMLLAAKFNVKTLLLPEGDDPDSFAQNHSAEEVEKYFTDNERDIIAFMTEILMREVNPDDPTAKAKVINKVLESVAYVDEPVKRQEYIAQCSRMMSVSEEVLVKQLNIFITRRYEEDEKQRRRNEAGASIADIEKESEEKTEPAESYDAPLIQLDVNLLKPYEEMLMRYIVRYGLIYSFDHADENGEIISSTVFDVIDATMQMEELRFTYPPFAATMEALREIRNGQWEEHRNMRLQEIEQECARMEEDERQKARNEMQTIESLEKAEKLLQEKCAAYRVEAINEFDMNYGQSRLINSIDDAVRTTASELAIERYSLSKIYTKQGNEPSELEQIPHLVKRAIFELKGAIITQTLKELNKRLMAIAPDLPDETMAIMEDIAYWKEYQKELGKLLGERIILPTQR